ncbi:MAG: phosphotransferase [Pseudomonadota bacterium]
MTIRVMERPRRKMVGWLRAAPPATAKLVLEEREYAAMTVDPSEILKIRMSSAVVMTLREDETGELTKDLREHAGRFLDLGCRVLVRVQAHYEDLIAAAIRAVGLPAANIRKEFVVGNFSEVQPHILLSTIGLVGEDQTEWRRLARFLAQSDEEPILDAPNLIGPRARALSQTRQDLLMRAFGDCTEVRLSDVPQGRSAAEVLLAHPIVARPISGDAAPLFVKFDKRDEVAREHNSYENQVRPFVPYHLGPHLAERRCCLGAVEGVLVGTYIEESESLLTCAMAGRSAGIISGLLTRTLAGWHRSARIEQTEYGVSLASGMPSDISPARYAQAKKFGAQYTLDELRARVKSVGPEQAWVGNVHGDLHAENVRARGSDAVLIDFGKSTHGPLLVDPAALEASLFVGDVAAEIRAGQRIAEPTWRSSMARMYAQDQLRNVPHVSKLGGPCEWLKSGIRQIRLHAMNMEPEPGQYARALGVALLRTATRRPSATAAENRRRALAYVFGEKLTMMEWT